MSRKTVLIYPGQGAQYTGMCREFYDSYENVRELYAEASKACGLDLAGLCFSEERSEELSLTQYTQPAMVCAELAMTLIVKEELSRQGIEVFASAGLSLGEYAAISEAGALSFSDAVRTVYERGKLMAGAVPAGEGAMAAVINPDIAVLNEVLSETEGAYVANYNSPAQIVITGYKASVELAVKRLTERGIKRCVMLNVSGPFHSPLLKEAGEKLGKVLSETELGALRHPYYSNIDGLMVKDESEIREKLVRQVSGSVHWQQIIEAMLSEGVDTFIEIGPGRTLCGFIQKILRAGTAAIKADPADIKLINIEKPEDLSKIAGISEEI